MKNKKIIIVISIIIVASIFDISYARTFELIFNSDDLYQNILIFVIVSSVCVLGQFYVLEFVKKKVKIIYKDNRLKSNPQKIVTIIQYFTTAIIFIIFLQVIAFSYYSTSLIIISSTISYTLSIAVTILLTSKFFFWFRTDRNSIVCLYGLASAILVINLCSTFIFTESILFDKPLQLGPHTGTAGYSPPPNSILKVINDLYFYTSIASFLLLWLATATLLYQHHNLSNENRKKIITKYWILAFIPLIYFLSQFIFKFIDYLNPFFNETLIFSIILTLFFTLGKPIGGILFGAVLFSLKKGLDKENPLNDYLIISSFGILLIFVVNQGIALSNALYPPFGLATVSLMGLASYMFFIGLYSAAISSAQDSQLRRIIKKFAIDQSKLLSRIDFEEVVKQVENKATMIAKNKKTSLEIETGISPSYTEKDIQEYLLSILKEIKSNNNYNPINRRQKEKDDLSGSKNNTK